MVTTHSSFLLFIEPTQEILKNPIIDQYTRKMTGAMRASTFGCSGYSANIPVFFKEIGYKGNHRCSCGCVSTNTDYLLKTADGHTVSVEKYRDYAQGNKNGETIFGMITNSLCIHYLAYHRNEVSDEMLSQVLLLTGEETEPTEDELRGNINI